ncbi:MAG: hypothetical protein WAW00_03690 [Candidatus Moraniibacteriota bacterium]
MSFENPTPPTEKAPRFPSLKEIEAKMIMLSGQENPEKIRTLVDEKGVRLHEVVIDDDAGNTSLFSYRRSDNHQETKAPAAIIDVTYFRGPIEDGIEKGMATLAHYDAISGTWIDVR